MAAHCCWDLALLGSTGLGGSGQHSRDGKNSDNDDSTAATAILTGKSWCEGF